MQRNCKTAEVNIVTDMEIVWLNLVRAKLKGLLSIAVREIWNRERKDILTFANDSN